MTEIRHLQCQKCLRPVLVLPSGLLEGCAVSGANTSFRSQRKTPRSAMTSSTFTSHPHIVRQRHGGAMVSTRAFGGSHWFNLIRTESGWFEVDITGDQFGLGVVRWASMLHDDTRIRDVSEWDEDTHRRLELLEKRLGAL